MKVHRVTSLHPLKNPVMSIGIFDGAHKGHAAVFERVRQRAAEFEGESVIVTFWPHPRIVLGKESEKLKLLTTLEEKQDLISRHGIDHLFVLPFTREFARLPACGFVKQCLVDGGRLAHLVFGFNHHFGHGREGNFENLKTCARLYNFTLEQLDPVTEHGIRISSSVIREALCRGQVRLASALLSYHYSLQGTIVGGKQVGRVIGFPTANVLPDEKKKLIPGDGVYAVKVSLGDDTFPGMMNIGFRPTISGQNEKKSIEVHIFDFSENVYDHRVNISFIDRIRDEKKFENLDRLRDQLEKDKTEALRILSEV